ncbi:TIGR02206 family membrane protein [bacterium]|nr:TIGR02206 family membrane protein [bacterium]
MFLTTEVPFEQFTLQHVAAVLIIFVTAATLPILLRKKDSAIITNCAKGMGIVLLFSKVAEIPLRSDSWDAVRQMLPLHLCDVAAICTGLMLLNRNFRLYEVSYFWALTGTLQALLTPELMNGFPHMDYFFYFVSHGLIIVGVIYATVIFHYKPTTGSIWRTLVITALYAALIFPVNWLLDTNYLYLSHKPVSASLIDYLGPWPWYIAALIPIALILFFISYTPFWLVDLLRRDG